MKVQGHRHRRRRTTNITLTLVVVVSVFIVCELPDLGLHSPTMSPTRGLAEAHQKLGGTAQSSEWTGRNQAVDWIE